MDTKHKPTALSEDMQIKTTANPAASEACNRQHVTMSVHKDWEKLQPSHTGAVPALTVWPFFKD